MGADETFWKATADVRDPPGSIYRKLCRQEAVPGLERLPIKEILGKIRKRYRSFDPAEAFPTIECENGGAEVSWSEFHFRFDHAVGVIEPMPAIRRLMSRYGCSMYCASANRLYGPSDQSDYDERENAATRSFDRRLDAEIDASNLAFKKLVAAIGPREALRIMGDITKKLESEQLAGPSEYHEALRRELEQVVTQHQKPANHD